jgi:hypothetical protein
MELNQTIAVRKRPKKLAWIISAWGRPRRSTPCIEKVSGTNRVARKSPVRKGKGEASRMWKGCCWLLKVVGVGVVTFRVELVIIG